DPITGKLPQKEIVSPFQYDMVSVSDVETLYHYADDPNHRAQLKSIAEQARVIGRNGQPLRLRLERTDIDDYTQRDQQRQLSHQSKLDQAKKTKFKYSIEAMP